MGFDEVVLILCGVLWLLHALQLVRYPMRRTWPALLIAAIGVAASAAAALWWPRIAAGLAVGLVALLLVVPAVASRGASRALRWGNIARARLLASIAATLRPIPVQRRFRRSVDVSWRLGRGEPVDLEAALDALDLVSDVERGAHRFAFLSWTNDFAAMAAELKDDRVQKFALRSGMASIVTTALGETVSDEILATHYRALCALPVVARRNTDGVWSLIAIAAYAGADDVVREHVAELSHEVPPDRIAFVVATAEQRAGRAARAERTIAEAMKLPGATASSLARLSHRRDHPLAPASDALAEQVTRDVADKLRARRTLSALGLDLRRPPPATWALALALCAVYWWQVGQRKVAVFEMAGLASPWSQAPDAWRLLSYGVLHIDQWHLAVNALGLLVFGRFVERHLGSLRMLVTHVVGVVAGGVAFLVFSRGVAVGASAGVMALFGCTVTSVALDPVLRKSPQGRRELLFLGAIALLQLAIDSVWAGSAGSAHAGGLVAGAAMGGVWVALSRRAVT